MGYVQTWAGIGPSDTENVAVHPPDITASADWTTSQPYYNLNVSGNVSDADPLNSRVSITNIMGGTTLNPGADGSFSMTGMPTGMRSDGIFVLTVTARDAWGQEGTTSVIKAKAKPSVLITEIHYGALGSVIISGSALDAHAIGKSLTIQFSSGGNTFTTQSDSRGMWSVQTYG